jgi:hypothetical protein
MLIYLLNLLNLDGSSFFHIGLQKTVSSHYVAVCTVLGIFKSINCLSVCFRLVSYAYWRLGYAFVGNYTCSLKLLRGIRSILALVLFVLYQHLRLIIYILHSQQKSAAVIEKLTKSCTNLTVYIWSTINFSNGYWKMNDIQNAHTQYQQRINL